MFITLANAAKIYSGEGRIENNINMELNFSNILKNTLTTAKQSVKLARHLQVGLLYLTPGDYGKKLKSGPA